MIDEVEPLKTASEPATKLDQAKEAVQATAQIVIETTQSVSNAIQVGRRPAGPLGRLAGWTRRAPLQALALAFLFGIAAARRRQ